MGRGSGAGASGTLRPLSRRASLPGAAALAIAALAWAAVVVMPQLAGTRSPLDPLESVWTDWRLLVAGPVDLSLQKKGPVVVAIDDATLGRPGFGYPLSRARIAEIVDAIAEAGASALAIDMLFPDARTPQEDDALRTAMARLPTVVGAAAEFGPDSPSAVLPAASAVLWPAPFAGAAAGVGFVNIVTDASGTPRHVPLLFLADGGIFPHLALAAAGLAAGAEPEVSGEAIRLGERAVPVDLGYNMPLRLAGPRGTVPTIPAGDVLDGRAGALLAGRLAVLGFTARGVGDTFATPYDATTPGVEVIAGAAAQILSGDHLVRTRTVRLVDAALAACLAVLSAVCVFMLPLGLGVPLALGLLATALAGVFALFMAGIWLSAAIPLAAAVPPIAVAALARYLVERRAARRSSAAASALSLLQSPRLADRISRDPNYLREPEALLAALLFVDIAGFTGLSERLRLEGTRVLLSGFHTLVAQEVEARGGVVMNYIGDGVFAAFGVPETTGADADAAAATAFAIVPAVRAMRLPGAPEIRPTARVGIHYGTVLLSRLGAARHQQVTVTGDAVNVAARLVEAAKGEGAAIAASGPLIEMLEAPLKQPADRATRLALRGRVEEIAVSVWTLPEPAASGVTVRAAAG